MVWLFRLTKKYISICWYLNFQGYQEDNKEFRHDTTLVEVKVLDVNDNTPSMSMTHYAISVNENVVNGTLLLTVDAQDADLVCTTFSFTMII